MKKKITLNEEKLRMKFLSGIISEEQYSSILSEEKSRIIKSVENNEGDILVQSHNRISLMEEVVLESIWEGIITHYMTHNEISEKQRDLMKENIKKGYKVSLLNEEILNENWFTDQVKSGWNWVASNVKIAFTALKNKITEVFNNYLAVGQSTLTKQKQVVQKKVQEAQSKAGHDVKKLGEEMSTITDCVGHIKTHTLPVLLSKIDQADKDAESGKAAKTAETQAATQLQQQQPATQAPIGAQPATVGTQPTTGTQPVQENISASKKQIIDYIVSGPKDMNLISEADGTSWWGNVVGFALTAVKWLLNPIGSAIALLVKSFAKKALELTAAFSAWLGGPGKGMKFVLLAAIGEFLFELMETTLHHPAGKIVEALLAKIPLLGPLIQVITQIIEILGIVSFYAGALFVVLEIYGAAKGKHVDVMKGAEKVIGGAEGLNVAGAETQAAH